MTVNTQGCGPIGRNWIERDHRATSTSYAREYPLVVRDALGSEIYDMDGKRYLDLMAGVAVLNVGHRHPHVVARVREALDQFWHICLTDFYYPQAVELAEKLQQIAPMAEKSRIYFSNSGTEAIESAIKLAMYHTGRRQFIGFRGAFHGRTLGALSFTSSKYVQRAGFHPAVPVHHLPFPNPYRPILELRNGEDVGQAVLRYLQETIFETTLHPEDVAAVVIEPIQGEGGYVIPPAGFLAGLRRICDQHGILLVVDEVQSGIGRTGKMWAVEHEGVQPDILCFAKGIASGMPLGGIIARDSVMSWKPGSHASTYGGNPVACAAAIGTLEVVEREGLPEQAAELGRHVLERLHEMQQRHPAIGDIRGRGLMIGVEFVRDRESRERDTLLRDTLKQVAFEEGLLLLPCGRSTMRLTPALTIGRTLLDEGLDLFEHALTKAERLIGRS
jgi:4-aminobutyrate aminotransferase